MIENSQDNRYFDRMAHSLGDKSRVLEYLRNGNTLDVGAGGGELSEAIRTQGMPVWALDGSLNALRRIKETYPKVPVVKAFAEDVGELFDHNAFFNIVCCSILHEVFSYGDKNNSLKAALQGFHKTLVPHGRLIIRDGVMPDNWNEIARIKFKTDDGQKFLEYYKNNSPFYVNDSETKNNNASQSFNLFQKVHFDDVDENVIEGNMASIMEFLYTYTWDWGSAERETQELYGVLTESMYKELLNECGFNVVESYQYLQEGYVNYLSDLVEIFDDEGSPVSFPSSNMLIVAEKV